MASRSLDDLTPEGKVAAEKMTQLCKDVELDILIYCTLRPLEEQAKLYRQSRPWSEIKSKILKFNNRGFNFLGDILDGVGPSSGPHVTNAGPGESWHNYGKAWDAVPLIGGKPAWSYTKAKNEWDGYGEAVRLAGAFWAGDWVGFREYPHAQIEKGGNPLKLYPPDKIREMLVKENLL